MGVLIIGARYNISSEIIYATTVVKRNSTLYNITTGVSNILRVESSITASNNSLRADGRRRTVSMTMTDARGRILTVRFKRFENRTRRRYRCSTSYNNTRN